MSLLTKAVVAAAVVAAIAVGSTGAYLLFDDAGGEAGPAATRDASDADDQPLGGGMAMCAADAPDCVDTIVVPEGDGADGCIEGREVDCLPAGEQKDVPECLDVIRPGSEPETEPAVEPEIDPAIEPEADASNAAEPCDGLAPDCAVSSDGTTVCPERRPLIDDGGDGAQGSPGSEDPAGPSE